MVAKEARKEERLASRIFKAIWTSKACKEYGERLHKLI